MKKIRKYIDEIVMLLMVLSFTSIYFEHYALSLVLSVSAVLLSNKNINGKT